MNELKKTPWQQLGDINRSYALDEYEQYKRDPESVDPKWRELFAQWGEPSFAVKKSATEGTSVSYDSVDILQKAIAAERMAQYIRSYGHLAANIEPLGHETKATPDVLDFAAFGLSEADLKQLPVQLVWHEDPGEMQTAYDAIVKLKQLYTDTLAFQFSHVHEEEERAWLTRMVETGAAWRTLSDVERRGLLKRLNEVDLFEKFLHRTFVGQKRFSIEGLDMLVPMVDATVREGVYGGARHILIGMAHRGRLNMLAHVLDKPYERIFSEFQHAPNKEMVPSEGSMGINYGWSGDVKYHLGEELDVDQAAIHAHLRMANNPSHLEFVNPVVEGYTRAAQEERFKPGIPEQDTERAFAIVIHGDAAFPGEGIVAETLNLSRLRGYWIGGTIHIIANNQIGFTTKTSDSRSTKYASDLARGFEIPIVYVNADDPEACLAAVNLAYEYRKKFKKDFLIDLIGYRKFGHNEMDDPEATQPQLYQKIHRHPSVRVLYGEKLKQRGLLAPDEEQRIEQEVLKRLQEAYEKMKEMENQPLEDASANGGEQAAEDGDTGVALEVLQAMNQELLQRPQDFHVYPKLEKILQKRLNALDEQGKVDWAHAETLAFATILREGTPIRFTGQDTERGTFAHRHLVLHDTQTGKTFNALQAFSEAKASFAIYNSALSEAAALGFEYGYDVFAQNTMVLWEAQFGDFANAAQVIIDQFLMSGQAKWRQKSSLVLLLPHGYEGQGPEHSSARLERYLQLAAERNCTIANLTSAAQYFHLLRRRAARLGTEEVCPLIIMAPKSLLRNPRTASPAVELTEGRFQTVLEAPNMHVRPDEVERLILCSGKIAIELQEELEAGQGRNQERNEEQNHDQNHDHELNRELKPVQILRIEQLYPFPSDELQRRWSAYPKLQEVCWVQEEPENMGAWRFIEPHLRAAIPPHVTLRYIGRPERSSPAVGFPNVHKEEQKYIIHSALY